MSEESPIIFPRQVQLFVSEICNEGCGYCPYTRMTSKERRTLLTKELSIEQWQEATLFLYKNMGIRLFTLIGGEPAAKKGIEELVRFMTKELSGAEVIFSTSGIPLLRNPKLKERLVEAGMRNVIVSVDGIKKEPSSEIDLTSEIIELKKGAERKSNFGLYFLLKLQKEYPNILFRLCANCIVNKETLDYILPTYAFLSERGIYLNLCPEQTFFWDKPSLTVLTAHDREKVEEVAQKLIYIKRQPGNYLVPSEDFLKGLPTWGINQSYKCSARPFPTTLHLDSSGNIPYCLWRSGEMAGEFNIRDLMEGRKTFEEWLIKWRMDKEGRDCSCSWTFLDRVGDFSSTSPPPNPNMWYTIFYKI